MPSPGEIVRLRSAAISGLRDAVWGTTLGWLFLTGQISPAQFAIGKRWMQIAKDYSAAVSGPRSIKSAALEPMGGTPPDVDSEQGRKQSLRDLAAVAAFETGLSALNGMSTIAIRMVRDVCERDVLPAGLSELVALRQGLAALAVAERAA